MNSSIKKILGASFIGMMGGLLSGLVNFVSLPILISIYGKPEYGLVSIALSANSFLQILSMGVPTGAVKNFSEWLEGKDYRSLQRGVQSNLLFFTCIGFINSCVLIYLALNADVVFNVDAPKTLGLLFGILSVTSFINWYFISFQHLLAAYEKMAWVSLFNSFSSIINIVALISAYYFEISIVYYFAIYTLSTLIAIPFNVLVSIKSKIFKTEYLFPWFWKKEFGVIISYSMGLFMVGILQYLANQSQPILLGAFSPNGDILVANYKILQNITMIVTMIAGVFLQNFIPYITKTNYRGETDVIKDFVFKTTKWLSVYVFFVCAYVIFNADRLIMMYVGENGAGLYKWLIIWMIGIMFQNNQGISSVVLGTGKFKYLIYSLFVASVISVSFSIALIDRLGVGVVPIGFVLYKLTEATAIYGFYLPKLIGISIRDIFNNAIKKPFLISLISVVLAKIFFSLYEIKNDFLYTVSFGILSLTIYGYLLYSYMILDSEKKQIIRICKGAYSKVWKNHR